MWWLSKEDLEGNNTKILEAVCPVYDSYKIKK